MQEVIWREGGAVHHFHPEVEKGFNSTSLNYCILQMQEKAIVSSAKTFAPEKMYTYIKGYATGAQMEHLISFTR